MTTLLKVNEKNCYPCNDECLHVCVLQEKDSSRIKSTLLKSSEIKNKYNLSVHYKSDVSGVSEGNETTEVPVENNDDLL